MAPHIGLVLGEASAVLPDAERGGGESGALGPGQGSSFGFFATAPQAVSGARISWSDYAVGALAKHASVVADFDVFLAAVPSSVETATLFDVGYSTAGAVC